MANEYAVNQTDLSLVADKIREKSGSSEKLLFPSGFAEGLDSVYDAGYNAGYEARKTVDNDLMKVEAIEFSLDDWVISSNDSIYIYHSLGTDPDTVLILPSHHNWTTADQNEGYYKGHTLVSGLKRSYISPSSSYGDTLVEYYDADIGGYSCKIITEPVLDWSGPWVRINPWTVSNIAFAPSSGLTYKVLLIKHIT